MIQLIDIYQDREDVERFLYQLMAERLEEGDTNISHVKMPTRAEHHAFIKKLTYRAWYVIATKAGDFAGAVSLSHSNELGIVVRVPYRKRGLAKAALLQLMVMHPPRPGVPAERPSRYVANIRAGNEPSIALFKSLGATLLQQTYII